MNQSTKNYLALLSFIFLNLNSMIHANESLEESIKHEKITKTLEYIKRRIKRIHPNSTKSIGRLNNEITTEIIESDGAAQELQKVMLDCRLNSMVRKSQKPLFCLFLQQLDEVSKQIKANTAPDQYIDFENYLFLTGESGVGKTTSLLELISKSHCPCLPINALELTRYTYNKFYKFIVELKKCIEETYSTEKEPLIVFIDNLELLDSKIHWYILNDILEFMEEMEGSPKVFFILVTNNANKIDLNFRRKILAHTFESLSIEEREAFIQEILEKNLIKIPKEIFETIVKKSENLTFRNLEKLILSLKYDLLINPNKQINTNLVLEKIKSIKEQKKGVIKSAS